MECTSELSPSQLFAQRFRPPSLPSCLFQDDPPLTIMVSHHTVERQSCLLSTQIRGQLPRGDRCHCGDIDRLGLVRGRNDVLHTQGPSSFSHSISPPVAGFPAPSFFRRCLLPVRKHESHLLHKFSGSLSTSDEELLK